MEENLTPQPISSFSTNNTYVTHPSPLRKIVLGLLLILLCIGLIGSYFILAHRSPTPKVVSDKKTVMVTPIPTTAAQKSTTINIHQLPLGDGKVSTTPKAGYVYSCQTQFQGGGAQVNGPWIHGNTWDLSQKIGVQGNVTWPTAQFSITTNQESRIISGNGLPVTTETGIFPIKQTDPAYQIDRNPNSIKTQTISFTLPLTPQAVISPSCVPMGMIGVALNGVAIFNALDAGGRDAVAHEVQDSCGGHPQQEGEYHYHGPSACLPNETQKNQLVGYALDGFGIYSMYDANGRELSSADLDECHGTTSPVMWDGKMVNMYHYVLTQDYPYTIGCFKGTVVSGALHKKLMPVQNSQQNSQSQMPPRSPQRP